MSMADVNLNKEIMAGISYFMKYIKSTHNISTENIDLSHFMEIYQKKRAFEPLQDTFLHICQFLEWHEIIKFSIIRREYANEYYPAAWHIIYRQHFPMSIDRPISHISMRDSLSLDCFYHILVDHGMLRGDWHRIKECEDQMEMFSAQIKYIFDANICDEDFHYYVTALNTNRETRDEFIKSADPMFMDFIRTFQFNSVTDVFGEKYYTIKPEIDVKVYGIDSEKDAEKAKTKRLWMTGEYTEEIHYIGAYEEEDPAFKYGIDSITGSRYKYRVRPDYC